MLDNDINNWIHYYAYTFIIQVAKGEENEAVNDLRELYAFVLTGYILDTFREKRIDIKNLVEGQVLAHKTNQYYILAKLRYYYITCYLMILNLIEKR